MKKLCNTKESFEIFTYVPKPELFLSHIFELSLKNATYGLFFAIILWIIFHR